MSDEGEREREDREHTGKLYASGRGYLLSPLLQLERSSFW